MAIGLYPENINDTAKSLWSFVDDILFALKDKSTEVFQKKKRKFFLKKIYKRENGT